MCAPLLSTSNKTENRVQNASWDLNLNFESWTLSVMSYPSKVSSSRCVFSSAAAFPGLTCLISEIINYPVKNVTWIFSCLFAISLVGNDPKSDGNPIIFLANAMKMAMT